MKLTIEDIKRIKTALKHFTKNQKMFSNKEDYNKYIETLNKLQ